MATPENGLVKGLGLVLITGKKGSGKSHFATSQIKHINDNFPEHQVYADIAGLDIKGVLPSPDDWQTLINEDGFANCTIFYDEAQRLPWADNSSSKINSDSRIREMTMIRHANINIVIMTQDPTFVHSALRKLVDVHYHISHPFKDGKPKVFHFSGTQNTIDDKGAYKREAVDSFIYKLDEKTSELYKSVEDGATHDQKKKIPKRIIYMGLLVLFIIGLAIPAGIWGVAKVYSFISGAEDRGGEMIDNAQGSAETIGGGGASGFPSPDQSPNGKLTKSEIKELHEKYLSNYTVEVANDDAIRPASIMAMGGTCKAYNKFGDGLDITQTKCNSMLSDPSTIPHPRNISRGSGSASDNEITSNNSEFGPQRDFINNPPPPVT